MEEDCVSGLFSIFASCLCSEQNSEVSVNDNNPNYNQIHNIGHTSLLDDEGIWEDVFSETEDSGMKEVQWLCGQSEEQIRKTRQNAQRPD